jgi:dinuclear metal center YbgI/SA1388 family protein
MARLADVLAALEEIAPKRFAFSWDRVGLQVGDPSAKIQKAVVSLDRSLAAIRFAQESGANLLLTHHPLIFEPIAGVTSRTYEGRAIAELITSNIAHACAHTNWDAAAGGINDALAGLIGLHDVAMFGSHATEGQVKLVTFVPSQNLDKVIDACSAAGAGAIGGYRRCAFSAPGTGTYEPGPGTSPSIGKVGVRESVDEIKLEMVCQLEAVGSVDAALRSAHPYEEPAIDWLQLMPKHSMPMGRVGTLSQSVRLPELAQRLDQLLGTRCLAWGDPQIQVSKVAVVGGAADGEWRAAQRSGADVLVTGEVKQHVALEAAESGFALIAAGHYATEQPGCVALAKKMAKVFPDVEWSVFEPEPGSAGRPI